MFKYLFTDDRWIEQTHAVHRETGMPVKHPGNPLLRPDRPWETSVYCYGTCLYDEGRYRLWYESVDRRATHAAFRTAVGYAESADGIHWTKPMIGAVHPDHGPTNLVLIAGGRTDLCAPSVIRDDSDPDPARRYKMLFYDAMTEADLAQYGAPFPPSGSVPGWRSIEGEGMFTACSADGIHWQRRPQPVFAGPSDAVAFSRAEDGRYLAFCKTSTRADRHFRIIATSESRDFESWSEARVVLEPDWHDPQGTEFYGMSGFDYFGNRLGLVWAYYNSPDDKRIDVQLAGSSDGQSWQRLLNRETLLPNGPKASWDAGEVLPPSVPLLSPLQPDRLLFYYGGCNVRHDDMRYQELCIGLATLRLDGFAAMRAGFFPGALRTSVLKATGETLHVNLDAAQGGLSVDLVDAESETVLASAEPIKEKDSTALQIVWQSAPPPIAGRRVRLVFRLHRAALYAFWFGS